VFKADSAEQSRHRIINMPIPDFRTLDPRIDDKLNEILQRALARDISKRYATADELLYALEHYIYSTGYGPTNETLGKYMRELFGQQLPAAARSDAKGSTQLLEQTARVRIKKA
jgi:hypothetical protein